MALCIFANELQDKCLILHTDNLALVYSINNQTSKCSVTMALIRKLVVKALVYNIKLRAVHISSKANVLSDLLSRAQVKEALQIASWLNREPLVIPPEFQPCWLVRPY